MNKNVGFVGRPNPSLPLCYPGIIFSYPRLFLVVLLPKAADICGSFFCIEVPHIIMKLVLATRPDAERVSQLRIEAYSNANGTVLRDFEFLKWSPTDDQACILCIEDGQGRMIASTRVIQVETQEELESLCDAKITNPPAFPTLYFDKLVALVEYRQQRLSMVFRLLVIEAALQSDAQSLSFTINESAKRIPLMKSMGYTFSPADLSHRPADNVFDNSVNVLVACLNRRNFEEALAQGRKEEIVSLADLDRDEALTHDLLGSIRAAWAGQQLQPC